MNAGAASCVIGTLPPPSGNSAWVINDTTTVTPGCVVTHNNDIRLLGGAVLSVQGILNVSGWINVSQGAILEVSGGALHVQGGAPGVLLQLGTGSVVHVENGLLDLDGLAAPGLSNQANIEFINATVNARGYFSATANSVKIRSSTVNVTAPSVGTGQNGGDALMRIGGRISADVTLSTFIAQGAAGGVGTQGGRGGDGGAAITEFQPRNISIVT